MFSCQHIMVGTLNRLPAQAERKVGTTSSHHGPYVLCYIRATMVGTERSNVAIECQSSNVDLSSDRGLQLDILKLYSLVIALQQSRGEYVPDSCTHRPSRQESWGYLKYVTERS